MKRLALIAVLSSLGVVPVSLASNSGGILLDCDRYGGENQFQIYINESKGYVLYNANLRNNNYERARLYDVTNDKGENTGEVTIIDEGLDILINNDLTILAGDEYSSFLFVKKTAFYGYAWVTLADPGNNGDYAVLALSHNGKCSTNPFAQPKK